MLVLTPKGLYCPAGNFHIDPKGAVEHAVVTHAHSDHARRGAKLYTCARSGRELLRVRLGKSIAVQALEYGEAMEIGGVTISLHSAGHILGSAQVRIEKDGEVWLASGDYKREADPTCEPFETVVCDTFVTEATFGTPSFVWPKEERDLGREIHSWWQENAALGLNSILFAYSLGKAQRVLGVLAPFMTGHVSGRVPKHVPGHVYCHPAAMDLNECYRAEGIKLASARSLTEVSGRLRGELLLVPQSFLQTPRAETLLGDAESYRTAFASGWMARGSHGFDRGFLMSDHADWPDLLRTIRECRAKTVYVQHRGSGALVRQLRHWGLRAFPESDLIARESAQLAFF